MSGDLPLISTIIPVFNRERYLAAAVRSVIGTNYPHLEIILVDDASSDSSWELAKNLEQEYPGIVFVYQHPDKKNHGIAATRNLGIRQSHGKIICFLDSDDIFLPHRFECAIATLEERPELLGVYEPSAYAEDSPDFEKQASKTSELQDLIKRPIRGEFIGQQLFYLLLYKYTEYGWNTPGITLRRTSFDEIGFFDENFQVAEDTHLWIRLAATARVICAQDQIPVALVRRHSHHSWDGMETVDKLAITIQMFASIYHTLPQATDSENFSPAVLLKKYINSLLIEALVVALSHSQYKQLLRLLFWSVKNWLIIFKERLFWGNLIYGFLGINNKI